MPAVPLETPVALRQVAQLPVRRYHWERRAPDLLRDAIIGVFKHSTDNVQPFDGVEDVDVSPDELPVVGQRCPDGGWPRPHQGEAGGVAAVAQVCHLSGQGCWGSSGVSLHEHSHVVTSTSE